MEVTMKVQPLTLMSLAPLFAVLVSAGCAKNQQTEQNTITTETSGQILGMMKVDVNDNPLHTTVCDPFTDTSAPSWDKGIRATLHPLPAGMAPLTSSLDYMKFIVPSEQKLFFADMNVPTRLFSKGFATQTQDVLKDDAGNKLIENFAVKFETTLKLSEADTEGTYELALLSDDGTTLKTKKADDTDQVLISNDGEHPTKMGCSSQLLTMKKDTAVPLTLSYYQGPRYHIANVLIWRKATKAGKDSLCGASGNSLYFDPDHDSKPLQAFKDLQARGWKVVSQDNFFIPAAAKYNPCVGGTAPVITNFAVAEVYLTGVSLRWTTDIPSTTQVKFVNKATGEIILTAADNALYTDHRVVAQNLQPETTYTAQAVSVTDDLGHALSPLIEFTTP